MARRVVLHVGTPKTGTTAVQNRLFRNPDLLAQQDVTYPAWRRDAQFLATIDLLDLPWSPAVKAESMGAWDELSARARRCTGTVIISHELLVRASEEQISRAIRSFGDAEVSVVITARDLGRQIPAEYQEHIKWRRVLAYDTFLDQLRDPDAGGPGRSAARVTWNAQDVPALAARWAALVGPGSVTLVTLPPSDAPRDELIRRFGQAVGLMTEGLIESTGEENRSLGARDVELIRRFNQSHAASLDAGAYEAFVQGRFTDRAAGVEDDPLVLPMADYMWFRELSERWVADIRAAGYHVVGDLDELLPTPPPADFVDPASLDSDQLLDAALRALAESVLDFEEARLAPQHGLRELVGESVKRRLAQRRRG